MQFLQKIDYLLFASRAKNQMVLEVFYPFRDNQEGDRRNIDP